MEFLRQLLVAFHGIGMSALPIAHFAAKFADLATQFPQFPLQSLQRRAVAQGTNVSGCLARKIQKRGSS